MADISTPSREAQKLELESQLCRHLMEGNRMLRFLGPAYLPKLEGETEELYTSRLYATFLYNGFRRGIGTNRSRVFGKPIRFLDSVPEEIRGTTDDEDEGLVEDIDLCGRHLQIVAGDWFQDAMVSRVAWALVDWSKDHERPFVKLYTVGEYLGCNNGAMRFKENCLEPDGEWGEKEVERIRVLYPGRYEVHIKTASGWVLDAQVGASGEAMPCCGDMVSASGKVLDKIPVVRFQIDDGLPFEDLAEVCLAYWRSNAKQRTLLDFARNLILHKSGVERPPPPAVVPPGTPSNPGATPQVNAGMVSLGPMQMFLSREPSAHMEYVEHTGKAIEVGADDLDDLREMMADLALEPLLRQRGGGRSTSGASAITKGTATGAGIVAEQINSVTQGWALRLKDALEQVLALMAEWMDLPTGGEIEIPTLPGLASIGKDAAAFLLQLFQAKALSRETLWQCISEYLPEDFDAEAEAALIDGDGSLGPAARDAFAKLMGDKIGAPPSDGMPSDGSMPIGDPAAMPTMPHSAPPS